MDAKDQEGKEKESTGMSRRNFITKAGAAAAAITILPSFTVSGLGHVVPSDKLHIAAIGCGGEGAADIEALMRNRKGNAVISHLCDVDMRNASPQMKNFPKATFYKDWREMFDKESKNFDAVTVAIPDHNHATVGLHAMKLKKHLYLQKPLTHDIYEARILTEAAKKYQVVTQMGDQGASCDGMRTLREWIEAGILGDIEQVYCWTDRPVWPQGIAWPTTAQKIPKELDWDLWLGTAKNTNYIDNLVPFNWRGWWEFGTGALGDMGCHIIGPPFKLLELGYPTQISGSASTIYKGVFKEGIFPESGPVASSLKFSYTMKNGKNLDLYWMDGGITPERPIEFNGDDRNMNSIMGDFTGLNDFEGATLFVGSKAKATCGWGGRAPVLLPLSLNEVIKVPQKYPRIDGDMDGHYWQWIDACLAGYGNAEVDSPFEGYAGPLTETVLMGNLVLRSFNIAHKEQKVDSVYGSMDIFSYPGRNINFKWDGPNMRITNFEQANQFIKREYREGWGKLEL